MYEPKLGRFLSRDPRPENGIELLYPFPNMTRYAYVQSSPITFSDPSGLQRERAQMDLQRTLVSVSRYAQKSDRGICPDVYCPKDCSDPCGDAKRLGLDALTGPSAAGVICCDGKKYVCVWKDFPYKCLTQCAKLHEQTHLADVDCPEKGLCRPPFRRPEDTSKEECEGFIAQIKCLIESSDSCCDSLQGDARQQCQTYYTAYLEAIRKLCLDSCKSLGSQAVCKAVGPFSLPPPTK